jgi:pimeloyl-ACP methyl ester carboxylesterase
MEDSNSTAARWRLLPAWFFLHLGRFVHPSTSSSDGPETPWEASNLSPKPVPKDRSATKVPASASAESRVSVTHTMIPEGDVPSEPISSIAVPTLVIHGTADPMFPLAHGQALASCPRCGSR